MFSMQRRLPKYYSRLRAAQELIPAGGYNIVSALNTVRQRSVMAAKAEGNGIDDLSRALIFNYRDSLLEVRARSVRQISWLPL